MAQNRCRKKPFTSFEKQYLRELIHPHVHILESNRTNNAYSQKKLTIWQQVANHFNASKMCTKATTAQLKKLWFNMKARAREARSLQIERRHLGGCPPRNDIMSAEDEATLAILPNIKVNKDSDGQGPEDGDDSSESWKRQPSSNTKDFTDVYDVNIELCSEEMQEVHDISTLDPPSVRQTNAQQNPADSTEAPPFTTFCSSQETFSEPFSRSPKKNSTIEAMKIKLLENDLKHRQLNFELEYSHKKKTFSLQQRILEEEFTYKRRQLEMAEEVHKLKMQKLGKCELLEPSSPTYYV